MRKCLEGNRAVTGLGRLCILGCLVLAGRAQAADAVDAKAIQVPPAENYRSEQLEGWTCQISPRLFEAEHKGLREQTLRLLGNQLYSIKLLVQPERLVELQETPIWIDYESPLSALQYHPSDTWLREHGHHWQMAKSIHIPNVRYFLSARHTNEQPWAIMHELAHAYHHNQLGFEDEKIKAAFDRASEQGLYESVLHVRGDNLRHYAMTNHKEFFAEMSEAYFGTNDFFPFVRGELKRHDPATFELLQTIWGELPRK